MTDPGKPITIADLLKRPHNKQGSFDNNHPEWEKFDRLVRCDGLPLSWKRMLVESDGSSGAGITYLPGGWDDEKRGWRLIRRPSSIVPEGLFLMKAHAITDVLPARYQQCYFVKCFQAWYLLEKMMTEGTWRRLREQQQPASIYER